MSPFRALKAAAALIFSCQLFVAQPVIAAACCTSATAFGVGRLLMWENFAVGTRLSLKNSLGFFGDNNDLIIDEDTAAEVRSELYSLVALSKQSALFVQVPFVFSQRRSFGDVSFGVRHQLIGIGEYLELPGIALMSSISVPSGADETAYSLFAGAAFEKTFDGIWFTQLNVGGRAPLPITLSNQDILWSGLGLDLGAVVGLELIKDVVVSLSLQYTGDSSQYYNGVVRTGSNRYKLNSAFGASWRFDPHWTIISSLSSDLFIAGLGRHFPSAISGGVGIRYGYF